MKRVPAILVALACAVLPVRAADEALSPAANAAFLAADARKPGTMVRASGLRYRVLKSGFGHRPGSNDLIRISYKVTLINGTLVDGSAPALPSALAMNSLAMAGLAEALPLMREGDRWQLVVPANLALGSAGSANGAIPPNQTLIFDLTLVSAAPPRPGENMPDNPFSFWGDNYTSGARFTIRQ